MIAIYFTLLSLLICPVLLTGCRQIFGDGTQPESIVEAPVENANIIVSEPVHGNIWKPGENIRLKWIAPTIKKNDIQLYRKNEYKFTITENLESSGNFDWIVPLDIPLSTIILLK